MQTHHGASARSSDEVKLAVDVTDLVPCWTCWVEKCDNGTVGILQLKGPLRVQFTNIKQLRNKTYENICIRGTWTPPVLQAIRPIENPRTLFMFVNLRTCVGQQSEATYEGSSVRSDKIRHGECVLKYVTFQCPGCH